METGPNNNEYTTLRENDYAPNIDLRAIDTNTMNNRFGASNRNGDGFMDKFKQIIAATVVKGRETTTKIVDKVQDPEFRRDVGNTFTNMTNKAKAGLDSMKDNEKAARLREGAMKTYEEARRSLSDRNVLMIKMDAFKEKVKDVFETIDSEEFRNNLHKKLSDAIDPHKHFKKTVKTHDIGISTDDIETRVEFQDLKREDNVENKRTSLLFDSDEDDILSESEQYEDKRYSNNSSFYEINPQLHTKEHKKSGNDDSFSI